MLHPNEVRLAEMMEIPPMDDRGEAVTVAIPTRTYGNILIEVITLGDEDKKAALQEQLVRQMDELEQRG